MKSLTSADPISFFNFWDLVEALDSWTVLAPTDLSSNSSAPSLTAFNSLSEDLIAAKSSNPSYNSALSLLSLILLIIIFFSDSNFFNWASNSSCNWRACSCNGVSCLTAASNVFILSFAISNSVTNTSASFPLPEAKHLSIVSSVCFFFCLAFYKLFLALSNLPVTSLWYLLALV